jgi:ADP-ribose pyrophosphatase YjhB (NUDIX family)
MMVYMTAGGEVAADGKEIAVHAGGQDLLVSWHPPAAVPAGRRHGAEGVCVSGGGVVLVSRDGQGWSFPAGRPEAEESWAETLRREVREEACATVVQARLLGFSRGVCIAGRENGLVLVRSIWRADVELGPWDPYFEIRHRRLVAPADLAAELTLASHPFAPIVRRTLQEAGLA